MSHDQKKLKVPLVKEKDLTPSCLTAVLHHRKQEQQGDG
jgi:hypothetical protein